MITYLAVVSKRDGSIRPTPMGDTSLKSLKEWVKANASDCHVSYWQVNEGFKLCHLEDDHGH